MSRRGPERIPHCARTLLLAMTMVSLSGPAGADAATPPHQVRITEVSVAFGPIDTIKIIGENLFDGDTPTITLGDSRSPLTLVGPPTDTEIVVECPLVDTVPTCAAGDFLLTVSTGPGTTNVARYALTIGAVGPEGDMGPEGPQGPQGTSGTLGAVTNVSQESAEPIDPGSLSQPLIALCPAGTVVTGGGGFANTTSATRGIVLTESRPTNSVIPVLAEGWIVRWVNLTGVSATPSLTVTAICVGAN